MLLHFFAVMYISISCSHCSGYRQARSNHAFTWSTGKGCDSSNGLSTTRMSVRSLKMQHPNLGLPLVGALTTQVGRSANGQDNACVLLQGQPQRRVASPKPGHHAMKEGVEGGRPTTPHPPLFAMDCSSELQVSFSAAPIKRAKCTTHQENKPGQHLQH